MMTEQAQAEIAAMRQEYEMQHANMLHELTNRAALVAVLNMKVQALEKENAELKEKK